MKKIIISTLAVVLLSGCEISITPPRYFNKIFATKTNSRYYERKARSLVDQLVSQMELENTDKRVNRIAVLDLVDRSGRAPELGRYMSLKIANEISMNNYYKLAPKGDLLHAIGRLKISYDTVDLSSSKELGVALKIEAFITGKIIDIGTNIDINLNSVDAKTGEVIASASETIARSNFAYEMLKKY